MIEAGRLQDDISKTIERHIAFNAKAETPLTSADICYALLPSLTTAFAVSKIHGDALALLVHGYFALVLKETSKLQATLSADHNKAAN